MSNSLDGISSGLEERESAAPPPLPSSRDGGLAGEPVLLVETDVLQVRLPAPPVQGYVSRGISAGA